MTQNISMDNNTFNTLKDPAPEMSNVSDVTWRKTPGGREIATKFAPTLKRRGYRLWLVCDGSPDDLTTWESFMAGLSDLSETFSFVDHTGDSFTARFLADPVLVDDEAGDKLIDIDIVQVST
jgi:hypothetical protein